MESGTGALGRRGLAGQNRGATRVWIVDASPVVREGLPRLLPPQWKSHAVAGMRQLLECECAGGVVVVDPLHLERGTGVGELEVALGIAASRRCHTLIYTFDSRTPVLARCMAAGAVGVVSKAEPISNLMSAIDEVAQTGRQRHCRVTAADSGPLLSQRQLEVLSGRARGEPFPSIAQRLGIASKTAAEYLAAVAAKYPGYLADHSPADLERALGLAPGDVFDWR